ncbi:hypothetical protein TWF679_009951 [Orbilia oligospora]|uniref:Uncharacterized protein n=1 Tax=Orbilia oligospora TaxID=2813651 RepID=A0A8H8V1N0_ORBOL|nr:hypothetical protein TWF679_009951 [Orbilia oligospora]
MPQSVWRRLPAWESQKSLLQICQQTCQRFGQTGMEIGRLANSNYFKCLKTLLYRLSNNLINFGVLDKLLRDVNKLGFRSSLKELLSLSTNTVRAAVENILPLLFLRHDGELINQMFRIHRDLQLPAKSYEAMLQLLEPDLYADFRSKPVKSLAHVPDEFSGWPGLEVEYPDRRAGKTLAAFLQAQNIFPSTLFEAAILVAGATKWGLMSITEMKKMLPSCFDLRDVETEYNAIFGHWVIAFENGTAVWDALSHGFRRDIYLHALFVVLNNDCRTAYDIIPFTEIDISAIPCMGECGDANESCHNGCLAEALGPEVFSRLLSATAREQCNQSADLNSGIRNWEMGLLSCSLAVACCLEEQQLYRFILNYLQGCYFSFVPGYFGCGSSGRESDRESGGESGGESGDGLDDHTSFRTRLRNFEKMNILTGALVEIINFDHSEIDPWYKACKVFRNNFYLLIPNLDIAKFTPEDLLEYLRTLVQSGAKIDNVKQVAFEGLGSSYEKSTVLNYAVAFLYVDLVKILLKLGADPNLKDHKGRTPITILLIILNLKSNGRLGEDSSWRYQKEGFVEILHELLTAGARFPTRSTCITWNTAKKKKFRGVSEESFSFHDLEDRFRPEFTTAFRIGDIDRISILWDGEFERFEPKESFGSETCTAKNERVKCLLLLLQNGCNPNEEVSPPGSCSISALSYAVTNGHLEIGKTLLEYGADIYKISRTHDPKRFQTPVEYAVELRRLDFIALFLLHSIECRHMALAVAEKYGHKTIAKWIKDEWMPKPLDPTNSPRDPSTYDIEDYVHEWCYE